MSDHFHSILLEVSGKSGTKIIISGFYRVWTHSKENSEASQVIRMDEFTSQISKAAANGEDLIIIGDANLDSNKWKDPKFVHANLVSDLFQVIDANGIKVLEQQKNK